MKEAYKAKKRLPKQMCSCNSFSVYVCVCNVLILCMYKWTKHNQDVEYKNI